NRRRERRSATQTAGNNHPAPHPPTVIARRPSGGQPAARGLASALRLSPVWATTLRPCGRLPDARVGDHPTPTAGRPSPLGHPPIAFWSPG
ncbi:hypothetical protein OFM39_29250, partial [Escherichia coli]|nr:hypothetical protein [Escherichia coli]